MKSRSSVAGVFAALAAGCVSSPPPAAGFDAAQYSHYDLRLRFDLDRARMMVQADWTLPPRAEDTSRWTFTVSPLMRPPRITRLRCGGEALSVVSLTSTIRSEGTTDQLWHLTSDRACSAGKRLRIALEYESDGSAAPQLRIDRSRGFAGGSGELWYPQLSYAMLDTGRITLTLPSGLTPIATGALVARKSNGDATEWVYETAAPAKLAFAFGPYQEGSFAKPVPLRVLTTLGSEKAMAAARGLAEIFRPLTEAFGPPPQPTLALVEIDFQSGVLGTGEYGMIFADVSKFREAFDVDYWAHEFGHQWWGNAVGTKSDSPGRALFSEGLAQYGALVAIEATRGPAAAAAYRQSGGGKDSLATYSKLVAEGRDRPLVGPVPATQAEILLAHRLATSKGAILLDQLSRMIGRRQFHALLQSFLAAHLGQKTSWAALEAHISAGTGDAYAWWFDQWLRRSGAPDLSVSHRIDGNRVRVEAHQKGDRYRLSIPIEVSGAWGRTRFVMELSQAQAIREFEAPGPVSSVTFDPDGLLPRKNYAAEN